MAEYEQIVDSSESTHSGWAIFGWLVMILLIAGVGYFLYKVWFYAGAFRRGEMVAPPSYAFQVSRGGLPSLSPDLVSRSLVEKAGRPSSGPEEAKLTVVMFGDFECPYCKAVAPVWRRMMNQHGSQVRFIYRHYPIADIHPQAAQIAEAAECAYEQGRFWPYHDKIYFSQTDVTTSQLVQFADQLGLDRVQFDRCLTDRRYQERVAQDIADGRKAGVSGTPTFFFNGQRIEGAIPEDIFNAILTQWSS